MQSDLETCFRLERKRSLSASGVISLNLCRVMMTIVVLVSELQNDERYAQDAARSLSRMAFRVRSDDFSRPSFSQNKRPDDSCRHYNQYHSGAITA